MGVEPGRVNDAGQPLPKDADMPNGIYPVPPYQQRASRSFAPSLWQRLKTWRESDRLDEQLAQGGDREAIIELRLRATQLVPPPGASSSPMPSRGCARGPRAPGGRSGVRRGSARPCPAPARREADRRSRGGDDSRLLTDRATSPLYRADARSFLKEAVRTAWHLPGRLKAKPDSRQGVVSATKQGARLRWFGAS
jgi:hypothetical protein